MSLWNLLSDICQHNLISNNSNHFNAWMTFTFLTIAFISSGACASDAYHYRFLPHGEIVELRDADGERGGEMPEYNRASIVDMHFSDEYGTTHLIPAPVEYSSIFERIYDASPGEVISLSGNPFYPDGTYVQDGNIYYPDGTVVENAFSTEITRIILPDGNILKPGEIHPVSENHAIDIPVTDEPW